MKKKEKKSERVKDNEKSCALKSLFPYYESTVE